jgi:hypothetical protein
MPQSEDAWSAGREKVQQFLAGSKFVCTDLQRLSGGYTNLIFKGTLVKPLPDGSTTVVVKHAESYVTPTWSLKADRNVKLHDYLVNK